MLSTVDPGDPLAHTQTEAGPARPDAGALAAGSSLGRYTLERVLGQGGMGVVWAAHDPDLDRRVAVKLLRSEGGAEGRARLLREARAMARLSHRNVITVHEVGSQGARDFVAMELIDGESLEQWLRTPRPAALVLDVFRDAGVGLACAHAAGMVHRDFKPHNVLLGRDGRVVVTDFGLARATDDLHVDAAPPRAVAVSGLEQTLAPALTPAAHTPAPGASWSSTLTATGALIGTPAYMAPEQFAGGPPDPRTDQFAFCVSLWEALAGERPYRGDTLAALARSTEAGPPTGHPRVPAWVVPALRRGLAPVPADRWPSMDALLAALRPPRPARWPWIAAAVGALAIAAGGVWFASRSGAAAPVVGAGESVCGDPAAEAAQIGTPDALAALRAHFASEGAPIANLTTSIERFRDTWRGAYAAVCADGADHQRLARVACLVGQRDQSIDQIVALAQAPPALLTHLMDADVWPHVAACRASTPAPPPPMPDDPGLRARVRAVRVHLGIAVMGAFKGESPDWTKVVAEAEALDYPPVLAEVLLRQAIARHIAQDLDGAAKLYDRAARVADAAMSMEFRADALLGTAELAQEQAFDPAPAQAAIDNARAAVAGAGNLPDQRLQLDSLDGGLASRQGHWDEAIDAFTRARAAAEDLGDRRRYLGNSAFLVGELVQRNAPGDLDRALATIRAAAAEVKADDRAYRQVHAAHAVVAMMLGLWDETRAADALAWADAPAKPIVGGRPIHGRVIDAAGQPVAGATVWANAHAHEGNPKFLITTPRGDEAAGVVAHTVTGADGRYTISAPPTATLAAELDVQRSLPARATEGAVLRMVPLHTIRGHIEGAVAIHSSLQVTFGTDATTTWSLGVPIQRDGTFEVGGVPAGQVGLLAMEALVPTVVRMGGIRLTLTGDLDGIVVRAEPGVARLDAIVRSDRSGSIPTAQVFVYAGHHPVTTISELQRLVRDGRSMVIGFTRQVTPTELAASAHYASGDTHVAMQGAPRGPATVCAVPLPSDLFDPKLAGLTASDATLDVRCVTATLGPTDQQVILVASPAPRLK
jgi:tetratricopeptide (TPR) repeat protein/predicted Ser/Thr protein kinase